MAGLGVSPVLQKTEFVVPATAEMWKYYRATDGVLPVARVFGGVRRGAFWDGKGGGGGERGGDGGCGGLLERGRGAGKHIGPTWNRM